MKVRTRGQSAYKNPIAAVAGACLLFFTPGSFGDPARIPSIEPVEGPGEPSRIPPSLELSLTLYLQSISPFSTVPQVAPATLTVPRNTELTLSVQSNFPVYDFVWTGAEEVSQTGNSSSAKVSFPSREQGWRSPLKGFSSEAHVVTVT